MLRTVIGGGVRCGKSKYECVRREMCQIRDSRVDNPRENLNRTIFIEGQGDKSKKN